ncbi:MAG: hypothetical protein J6N19_05695 [Clostridium sp.]|nr:hypothetical protein [Clostridium sp.]
MTDRDRDRIQSAIRHIQTAVDVDQWAADIAVEAMQEKITSAGHESYAKDRYEDLCEYFGNNEKTIRDILHDRKEFKEWLERMKWHVVECDRLGRIIEKVKRAQRQWVPCSERLPAEEGHYIVTVHHDYAGERGAYRHEIFQRRKMVVGVGR